MNHLTIVFILSLIFLLKNDNSYLYGFYKIDSNQLKAELNLKSNGQFTHKIELFTWDMASNYIINTTEYKGCYKIQKDRIIFHPKILIETLSIDDSKLNYLTDSTEVIDLQNRIRDFHQTDTFIYNLLKHSFRDTLDIIHWQENILLLGQEGTLWGSESSNDYLELINSLNCGLSNNSIINLDMFWSRKTDRISNRNIQKLLPFPWNEYILKDKINAEIVSVIPYEKEGEYDFKENIVIINKGEKDGLKKGMKLFATENYKCGCDLTITKTYEDKSEGYTEICGPNKCKEKTKVSTRCIDY